MAVAPTPPALRCGRWTAAASIVWAFVGAAAATLPEYSGCRYSWRSDGTGGFSRRCEDVPAGVFRVDQDSCAEPVNISFEHKAGLRTYPRYWLQVEYSSCCSAYRRCQDLLNVGTEYCRSDGTCYPTYTANMRRRRISGIQQQLPCYMTKLSETSCGACMQDSTSGCTSEAACRPYGIWSSTAGCVQRVCHEQNLTQCTEELCDALPGEGRWHCDRAGACRCRRCSREDSVGCGRTTCEEYGHHWKCDKEGACGCRRCCIGDCSEDAKHWRFCNETQCAPTEEVPDVKYVIVSGMSGGEDGTLPFWENVGHCRRCQAWPERDRYDSGGCVTRRECEAIDAFSWICDDKEEGVRCCAVCATNRFRGCLTPESCNTTGGAWCPTQRACRKPQEERTCREVGRCAEVPNQGLQMMAEMGYKARGCDGSTVDSLGGDWPRQRRQKRGLDKLWDEEEL